MLVILIMEDPVVNKVCSSQETSPKLHSVVGGDSKDAVRLITSQCTINVIAEQLFLYKIYHSSFHIRKCENWELKLISLTL